VNRLQNTTKLLPRRAAPCTARSAPSPAGLFAAQDRCAKTERLRRQQDIEMKNAIVHDMEPSLNEAANLANALAMAIQGLGKLDFPNEQEQLALSHLADQIRFAAHKSLDLWTQSHEAGGGKAAVS
jgi:hypothetical protein